MVHQVLFLCVVFMTAELNIFFLKFCLCIPPRNPLVVYRLILWWLADCYSNHPWVQLLLKRRVSLRMLSSCSQHHTWKKKLTLIFYRLLLPSLGFDHHSKPVKKFGAFCLLSVAIYARASYLNICMKLGHGELSLRTFLVRQYGTVGSMQYDVCLGGNILLIVCLKFK